MVAEHITQGENGQWSCSLAKISMVAEHPFLMILIFYSCSLAKISMVAEHRL